MFFTVLTGATSHGVEPPVTSGKSQEEEKYDCPCPCRCGNNMGRALFVSSQFSAVFIYIVYPHKSAMEQTASHRKGHTYTYCARGRPIKEGEPGNEANISALVLNSPLRLLTTSLRRSLRMRS